MKNLIVIYSGREIDMDAAKNLADMIDARGLCIQTETSENERVEVYEIGDKQIVFDEENFERELSKLKKAKPKVFNL